MRVWAEAMKRAIVRHVERTGSPIFTRQALFAAEGATLIEETKSIGKTPWQTATRDLQDLRRDGFIEAIGRGTYRCVGNVPAPVPDTPCHAVFVLAARADRTVLPEQGFVFGSDWLQTARRTAGQWVIYQGSGGYGAAAHVERVVTEEGRRGFSRAQIEQRSYLEFGRIVPLEAKGQIVEEGLAGADGRFDLVRAAYAVRAITPEDFNRILNLGLIADDELLPRDVEQDALHLGVKEESLPWEGTVDRTTMLVERKVRDRQFRKRVLEAYGARCALTGMKLINGGGRAETQAAHIKSVAAGGPDSVTNGIALSGTVHWMFDRGLISLSDAGDILLSRAINDRDSVERLIHSDRKARFPASAARRPNPYYLRWHRTECFHD